MEPSRISIKIGNFLYNRFFPLYSLLYPAFKKRQDSLEIGWMERLVRPGNIVLDIGANIGFYTLLLSDLIGPQGHIHAFEPDETNFKHLLALTRRRNNITLVPKAVSSASERITIYTSPRLNVDHRTYKVEDYGKAIPIEAVSIDDYVRGRFRVDVVKMDIQGYELHALRGMKRTIETARDILIFSEFWPYGFQQCGTSARSVYDYVHSLHLQIWLLESDHLRPLSRTGVEQLSESESVYYNVILSKGSLT